MVWESLQKSQGNRSNQCGSSRRMDLLLRSASYIGAVGGNENTQKSLERVIGWIQFGERMAALKLRLKKSTPVVLKVYTLNDQAEHPAFLLDLETAVKAPEAADNFLLMGDLNGHIEERLETY